MKSDHSSDLENNYTQILSSVNSQMLDQIEAEDEHPFQPLTNIQINANRRRRRSSSKKKLTNNTTTTSQVFNSVRAKGRLAVRSASSRRAKPKLTSRKDQISNLLSIVKEYIKEENCVVLKNRIKRAGLLKLLN